MLLLIQSVDLIHCFDDAGSATGKASSIPVCRSKCHAS